MYKLYFYQWEEHIQQYKTSEGKYLVYIFDPCGLYFNINDCFKREQLLIK